MPDALEAWGWDDGRQFELDELDARGEPARVITQERDRWTLRTARGEASARLASAALHGLVPVVGDWVVAAPGPAPSDPLSVLALLPRRTAFARRSAGTGSREQVLAANVDRVWIVHGLDTPPNLRRLERYLAVAWESGASPAVILTKADLVGDPSTALARVGAIAMGVPVHAVSALDAAAVERVRSLVPAGRTVALLGPSGAGKSTLVNALAGDVVAATGEVRGGDRKGRHTTTRRQLFLVPGGGLVIDTPGLRELRVGELDQGLDRAYADIHELALHCRFADCGHDVEPACAVRAAVDSGDLPGERLESYRKLQAEADHARLRSDPRARKAAISEHKTALKTMRFHHKRGSKGEG
jgi:ribosome biogenesis GTPase